MPKKTKKPAKKKAAKRKEEMWRCVDCGWEGPKSARKHKVFGNDLQGDVCPGNCPKGHRRAGQPCESEDVFPSDDEGWKEDMV